MGPILSAIDTERFGTRIARASVRSLPELASALDSCAAERVAMLIVRVPADRHSIAGAVEAAGGRLMDTVATWRRDAGAAAPAGEGVRLASRADAAAVEALARGIFAGYANHYRNDPRLAPALVDEIYPSWAVRLCTGAAPFLLAQADGELQGMAALALSPEGSADVELFGVAPHSRGQGIGARLLREAAANAARHGARQLTYVTHLTNLAAQRMLCAAGFVPASAQHTFHLWFTE
ncbi:MAG: GNAT family N-acetyltransferase [Burkholderiales bacterium]|nr:GNAT family N-acetyltransferase [Burkholderiales bacterium]